MTNPYKSVSISGFDDDSPPDDGSETEPNRLNWAKHIDEIGTPLKTAIESINTNIISAFTKIFGGGAVNEQGGAYTVQASDRGKIIELSGGGTTTLLALATAGDNFIVSFYNAGSADVTIDGSGSEVIDDESSFTLKEHETCTLQSDNSNSQWRFLQTPANRIPSIGALPRGHIGGLIISNNGTDGDHDIDVAAGAARDNANATDITLSAITKQIDATWAAGTNAGGLSSSLTAPANDTWYHVFAIIVGGSADVGFDTDISASNLVTDHSATAFRRIGSVLTDGSANIIAFQQYGDDFLWLDPPLDFNASVTTTAQTPTLSVPLDVNVLSKFNLLDAGSGNSVYVSPPAVNDEAPSPTAAPLGTQDGQASDIDVQGECWTDTSSQVRVRTDNGSGATIRIATLGWHDQRGKDD